MMRKFFRKILDEVSARIVMVVFGLVVLIFGVISPTRTLYAIKRAGSSVSVRDLICKDC